MAKCQNPDCDRDHQFEAALAAELTKTVFERCRDAKQPTDSMIIILAAAVVTTAFGLAKPGREAEALQDMVNLVLKNSLKLLNDSRSMEKKAKQDVEDFLKRAVREAGKGGHHG